MPKLKFGYSLNTLTAHAFLTFVDQNFKRDPNYVYENIDMNDIKFDTLISNSKEFGLEFKDGVTGGGKPLLEVCITNEQENGKWQLEKMMEELIDAGADPNMHDYSEQYTLLSYAYINKKHKAFKMLVDKCLNIDLTIYNKIDDTTIFGLLMYHCPLPYYQNNNY